MDLILPPILEPLLELGSRVLNPGPLVILHILWVLGADPGLS